MRRYSITDEEIKRALEDADGVISKAASSLNIPRKTFSNWVHKMVTICDLKPDTELNFRPKKKARYIITSVQNNTDIHTPFFNNLLKLANYYDAQLLIIPIRYKNVNAYINQEDTEVWWPPQCAKYYLNDTVNLNSNLAVLGDLKICATASQPLSGLETMAGRKSIIVGHPKVSLRMVATPSWAFPKQMQTTGSISLRNYSVSKAGKLADEAHKLAATIVEVQDDLFWTRQITATQDGSFYDLNLFFGVNEDKPKQTNVAGLSLGDIHVGFTDPEVMEATWCEGGLVDLLKPDNIYLHDVLDFYSQSHHNKNNLFTRFLRHKQAKSNVAAELQNVLHHHNMYWGRTEANIFYIPSNHHDHLTRWLNDTSGKDDIENSLIYHELMYKSLSHIQSLQTIPNPLELFLRGKLINENKTFFPGRNEKVELLGNAIVHGDKGANGAKPSARSFAKSGYKFIYGHTHTNSIDGGSTGHGTNSLLDLDYNQGLTNWIHSDTVIYLDGNTAILNCIKGRFYVFPR